MSVSRSPLSSRAKPYETDVVKGGKERIANKVHYGLPKTIYGYMAEDLKRGALETERERLRRQIGFRLRRDDGG